MKTVHEVAQLTGVSIRTLHHYDAIGLLKPTAVTETGYRLYDDEAIAKLGSILLYRELRFSLRDIRSMLESPDFDRKKALCDQIELLRLQRERLDRLIAFADEVRIKGENNMDFSAFDNSKLDSYAAEAKARWGGTKEYAEAQERGVTAGDAEGLMEYFARFGALRGSDPAGSEAQALAEGLRQYITDRFYTCSKEVFAGLGQMYSADERFRANIDAKGGEGTAEFASRAIEIYCK